MTKVSISSLDMPVYMCGHCSAHIKYEDIRTVIDESSRRFAQWKEIMEKCAKNMQSLTDSEQFSGETADSIKCYLSEVHGLLFQMIASVFSDFSGKYILYRDGYYNIDGNKDTELEFYSLQNISNEYILRRNEFADNDGNIRYVIDSVSDIAAIPMPDWSYAASRMKNMYKKAGKLNRDFDDYEYASAQAAEDLMQLITSVTALIKDYDTGKTVNPTTYESSDFFKSAALKEAVCCVNASQNYLNEHMDGIEAAYADEARVREQIQKEYEEELAKAREKAGILQVISGIGLAVVGTLAIVGTAGAATPLVAVGMVSGIGTCVFAGAEVLEGSENFYYGSQGDITTKSWNPVRDTIFFGNQEIYDFTKDAFSTVAGLSVPAAKAGKTAVAMRRSKFYGSGIKGACSKEILEEVATQEGLKAAGKEFIKDKATDVVKENVSNPLIDHFGDEIGLNDMQKEVVKKASDYAIDKGVDKGLESKAGEFWDKPDDYKAYKDIRGVKKVEKQFKPLEDIGDKKDKANDAAEILLHSEKPHEILKEAEKDRSDYEIWKSQQIFLQPD